mgnify:FL=1
MIKEINCLFCNKNIVSENSYNYHFYCNDCQCRLLLSSKSLGIHFFFYNDCFVHQKEILSQNKKLNGFHIDISYQPEFKSQEIEFYKSKCDIDDVFPIIFTIFTETNPFYSMTINTDDITLDCLKRTIIKVIKNHSYL